MAEPTANQSIVRLAPAVAVPSAVGVEPFESRLHRDREWGMSESDQYFQGKGEVHRTLKRLAQRLDEFEINYVVVGGLAMYKHGYIRFTDDVDLLVTRDALKEIHRRLDGLGYLPPFSGSKNLRDTDNGVKIEFLVTGEFPGDGKPKPVAFPNPDAVATDEAGIRYINLPALIELKLASGMTNIDRAKDIGDVVELIKAANLPIEFGDSLNPFVQEKYRELWKGIHTANRYVVVWSKKRGAAQLQAMLADGVTLDPRPVAAEDHVLLVTTDPEIAKKYGMHDEREFMSFSEGSIEERNEK
jgi:hypothetical protein